MRWRVIKMGVELFDALHAYGLGILVTYATGEPVCMQNEGNSYLLCSSCCAAPPSHSLPARRSLPTTRGG